MTAARARVVVTQRFFDQVSIDRLTSAGYDVVLAELPEGAADGDLSHETLLHLLQGAVGWIVGHARITRDLLTALPDLTIISRRGVGYDRIDLAAASELGKVVCIAAGGNAESVADHAIALMLAVGRRLRESQSNMLAGDWTIPMGSDLYGKTVGLVGLGRIARAVVRRLSGFEARILVAARKPDQAYGAAHGICFTDIDSLLAQSDIVSLHLPLSRATHHLIDARALRRMRRHAVIINTARGGLIDDRALLDALQSGQIAGAGLDVFASEDDLDYAEVTSTLLTRPEVVATPHSAASTREGLDRTNMIAACCVIEVLAGNTPPSACIVVDGRPLRAK